MTVKELVAELSVLNEVIVVADGRPYAIVGLQSSGDKTLILAESIDPPRDVESVSDSRET